MDKFLNEELFEVVLEKAFIEHEKDMLKSYPADDELESEYPISKKEIRRFKNIVKEKEYGKKLIRVYFDRVAVVILCIISLFFALIMTSSEVRAAVENVILKWYDKYTEFVFTEELTRFDYEKVEDVEIGYIPEKYKLETDTSDGVSRDIFYINIDNPDLFLFIEIIKDSNAQIDFDNEYFDYEKIHTNSLDLWVMYDEEEGNGGIVTSYNSIIIKITGYVSKEDLIRIVEDIK